MSLPTQLEARSVTHLQSLNKGLERKVIELQLKLVEKERERQAAQEQWNLQKCSYEKVLYVLILTPHRVKGLKGANGDL